MDSCTIGGYVVLLSDLGGLVLRLGRGWGRDEEMAFLDEREWFLGYRVVIRDDGTWWFSGIGME